MQGGQTLNACRVWCFEQHQCRASCTNAVLASEKGQMNGCCSSKHEQRVTSINPEHNKVNKCWVANRTSLHIRPIAMEDSSSKSQLHAATSTLETMWLPGSTQQNVQKKSSSAQKFRDEKSSSKMPFVRTFLRNGDCNPKIHIKVHLQHIELDEFARNVVRV